MTKKKTGPISKHMALRNDRRKIYDLLRKFCNMPISAMRIHAQSIERMPALEAMILKNFQVALEKGDLNFLKYVLSVFGVVEIKAVAIQEVHTMDDEDDHNDVRDVNLTKDEQLQMIERMKIIVESLDDKNLLD